jgi:hypothetical protein
VEPIPQTGNAKLDHYLALAFMVTNTASIVASALNAKIRSAIDSEGEAPKLFVGVAVVLNYVAFNLDKAMQMQKLLRGQSATVLRVAGGPSADPQGSPAGESAQP